MKPIDLPENFHWIIKDRLCASSTPSVRELLILKEVGVDAIVSLQNNNDYDIQDYTREDLGAQDIDYKHIPIPDFQAPSNDQFLEFIEYINNHPEKTILVHCYLGRDRTGTMLAAYLGYIEGLDGYSAIGKLRKIWSKYIGNFIQEEAVIEFLKDVFGPCCGRP